LPSALRPGPTITVAEVSSFQAMVSAGGKIFYVMDEGLIDIVLLASFETK
jgi:hypothetical protein